MKPALKGKLRGKPPAKALAKPSGKPLTKPTAKPPSKPGAKPYNRHRAPPEIQVAPQSQMDSAIEASPEQATPQATPQANVEPKPYFKHQPRLLVAEHGAVLVLTVSNPPLRNALGPEIYEGLMAVFERVKTDKSIRALVLTGEGGVFCGGGNLNRLRDNQSKPPQFQADSIDRLHHTIRALRACPLPIIAAVEGAAAGAGFSIALQCDMIIAAEDARFIMAYVKSGLTPDGGGSAMLGQLVPRQLAFELMATGNAILPQRLLSLGVVSQCVGTGEALRAALGAAQRLAAGPKDAIARIKLLSNRAVAAQDAQLDLERNLFVESLHSAEAREGIAAFLAKRKPDFSDKAA